MTTITINSFEHLITTLQDDKYCCGHVVFRGVKDQVHHKLIPSVGRLADYVGADLNDLVDHERHICRPY